MRILVTLAVATIFWSMPAFAADMAVKAPPLAAVAAPSLTGFYVGTSVGGRWANNDWTTTSVAPLVVGTPDSSAQQSFNGAAARLGGYAGYNWQFTPSWLIGIEGDFGWAHNKNT